MPSTSTQSVVRPSWRARLTSERMVVSLRLIVAEESPRSIMAAFHESRQALAAPLPRRMNAWQAVSTSGWS
jgi:hypothetical protein